MELDPKTAFEKALAKRRELQDAARGIGVSEEFISELVDRFYTKVQADPELGAVFNQRIGDRWPVHLAKMKRFWSAIALRDGSYEGRPMQVHLALNEARPQHFETWMRLFEQTLREIAPSDEVVEYFLEFARTMSRRFQKAMFAV